MAGENQVERKGVVKFDCPNCGATVNVTAVGQTLSVACGSCASIIDATDERHQILQKVASAKKVEPLIPLGTRGKLRGTVYEVIGFMERCDGTRTYFWREYLLFNPKKGFRWLTEFDGHWNYVISIKDKPEVSQNTATVLNKVYRLFLKGQAQVSFVLGEFYWRVKVGEQVNVRDYIRPPEMLSCEGTKDETIWSIGEYINGDEIRTAFNIKGTFPFPMGVAPNQPTKAAKSSEVRRYWKWFLIALFAFQFADLILSRSPTVLTQVFTFNPQLTVNSFQSDSFELTGGSKNVEVRLRAPVSNNWFEIEADLVNEADGDAESFGQGVEYYYGVDSDGSWSEGSQASTKVLSAVEGGRYHLKINASRGNDYSTALMNFEVRVKRNVTTWGNFIFLIILLSIYPIWAWWRERSFESVRWSQSDYSPYWSFSSED